MKKSTVSILIIMGILCTSIPVYMFINEAEKNQIEEENLQLEEENRQLEGEVLQLQNYILNF